MPRIAEVVNGFSSAEVQRQAFDALLASLGVSDPDVNAPNVGAKTAMAGDNDHPENGPSDNEQEASQGKAR